MTVVTSMSEDLALREGLRYIAHCLRAGEIYDPSNDEFIKGDAIHPLLIDFAIKLADGKLPNWLGWCMIRAQAQKEQRKL